MEAVGRNPKNREFVNPDKRDKSLYKSDVRDWSLRRMESREIHGMVNLKISEGGLVQYKLNLCYDGDCVKVERVALMGNWENITDKIKQEIRGILVAVEFDNFVIKEVKK